MIRLYSFITMLFVIGWSLCQFAHGQSAFGHPHAAISLSKFQQQNLWSTGKLYLPNSHSDFAMDSDLAINVTSRLTPVDSISLFGGAYWYHTKIINDTNQSAWVLSVDNGLIEFLDYYWLSDGQLTHIKSGYYEKDEYFLTYGKTLEIAKGQTGELLVLMDSPYYASLPAITMTSVDDYRQESLINLVIITLALGALLCLSLYNIFLYIGTKDPALFHYAAYLLSYFAAWALTFQLPTELFGFSALTLHYLPFFLLPYFSGCFCIHFLELRKTMPSTASVLKIIGVASAITGVLSIIFFSMAHTLATVFIGLWIAVALYAGIKRWLSGFKPASFFIVAFMCLLLPASIILPANIGIIPDLLGNSELITLVGGTLDAIFLAFAIAYRMRLISEENIQLTSELESKVMQRTEALAKSNKDLQQANESKRMFLANMSHEIRTPMTSIIGYADIMRKDAIATDKRQEFSTIIYDSSRHLLSILDDLLDLSKIEAKKLDFQMASVDLLSVISVSQNIHGDAFNEKPVEFLVHCQYPLPSHIETDEVRLKQILFNLISNALKFTEQGTVELNVSCRNEKLVFDIVDTGIGMDNEQISRLFNAFEQADNSISRRFGGTGLGLNISSQLALGLGGTLDCQSQLGRGSTFTLKLPLRTTSDTQWMAREPQQTIKPSTAKLEVILPNLQGWHILIADDLESNRGLFTLMLERVNAKVTCVNDGREAVDECARQTFDLILLDIHMPRMDGVEAMRTIKTLHPNALIIALTANTMTHQIAEFLTAGFDAHIAKPIVQSDFYGVIESTLKHSETNTGRVDEEVGAMLANLSELFLEELKSHLQAMARALKSSNWSVLKQHSHQLKGGAGSFGFSELGALCVELDNLVSVPEPQREPISSVLEKIEKVQQSLHK